MIDERTRHEMYLGLEENLGPDVADTLMKLLPLVGWADVATKHDLAAFEERIDLRFQLVDARLIGSMPGSMGWRSGWTCGCRHTSIGCSTS